MKEAFTLASVKAWLSSPTAFGWPLALLAFSWPILTGFGTSYPDSYLLPISVHLYDLIGALFTSSGVLLVQSYLTQRKISSLNPAVTVLLWLVISSLATAAQILISKTFGEVSTEFLLGSPIAALVTFGQLVFFTLVLSTWRELRDASLSLAKARKLLNFMQTNLTKELQKQKDKLLESVMATLVPQLEGILGGVKNSADRKTLSLQLRDSIDQVVRPLSHQIADLSLTDTHSEPAGLTSLRREISRVPIRDRFKEKIQISSAFNLLLFTAASLVFVLPGFAVLFGFTSGLLPALISLAIVIGVNVISKLFFTRVKLAAFWFVPISVAVGSASAWVFTWMNTISGQVADADFVNFNALNVSIIQIFSTLVAVQQEISWHHLEAAKIENQNLEAYVSRLRQEVWLSRQRLAKAVHGKTQSKLQAAALRLQISKFDSTTIEEIAQSVSTSLTELKDFSKSSFSLNESLEELRLLWKGVCEISLDVAPRLLDRIEASASTAGCLDELIREGVTNAIKHAAADEVDIRIFQNGENQLQVEIRNSLAIGANHLPKLSPGYGSHIFDEVSLEWSLVDDGSDAILKATLALLP